MVNRTARIAEEIKRELSGLIGRLKDPRLPGLVSVLSVEVTKDLRYAKVAVSVLGDDKNKKDASDALKSAAGFLRRELGRSLSIRTIPELLFRIDSSIETSIYMSGLIDRTLRKDRGSDGGSDGGKGNPGE
jgi:ribosome-binding factor A